MREEFEARQRRQVESKQVPIENGWRNTKHEREIEEETKEERRRRKRKRLTLVQVISGLLAIACGIGVIAVPASRYYSVTIQIQQAKSYMWEVRASMNLTYMRDYFQKALDLLGPFHGQAVWSDVWVPTADTNFDVIKANLQQAIDTCEVFQGVSPANTSYQFTVTNMQTYADEMADHLSAFPSEGHSLQHWTTWDQPTTTTFFILVGAILASLVICAIANHKRKNVSFE